MSTHESTTSVRPPENIGRGTLVALITVPLGIAVWVGVWMLGFIASIVAFGVALVALWLYRLGSGGRLGRIGATIVLLITLVTLALAFFAGLVADGLAQVAELTGASWTELIVNPAFWDVMFLYFTTGWGDFGMSLLLAAGFGALGSFAVLRTAFKQSHEEDADAVPLVLPGDAAGAPSVGADASVEGVAVASGEPAPVAGEHEQHPGQDAAAERHDGGRPE